MNKIKYMLVVIILTLLLIVASCKEKVESVKNETPKQLSFEYNNNFSSSDSNQLFLNYYNKRTNQNEYKYVYKYKDATSNSRTGIFKKGILMKYVSEEEYKGKSSTAYVYQVNRTTYLCGKSENPYTSEEEIRCSSGLVLKEPKKELAIPSNGIVIKYLGQKTIINRTCDELEIKIDDIKSSWTFVEMSGLSASLSALPKINESGRVIACYDEDTGFVLSMEGFVTLSNDSAGSTTRTYSAISISNITDDKEFENPIKFLLPVYSCNNGEMSLVINPLVNLNGNLSVEFLDSSFIKRVKDSVRFGNQDLKKWSFNLFFGNYTTYSDRFDVCLDNFCQEYRCFGSGEPECLKLSKNQESCSFNENCIWMATYCRGKNII